MDFLGNSSDEFNRIIKVKQHISYFNMYPRNILLDRGKNL